LASSGTFTQLKVSADLERALGFITACSFELNAALMATQALPSCPPHGYHQPSLKHLDSRCVPPPPGAGHHLLYQLTSRILYPNLAASCRGRAAGSSHSEHPARRRGDHGVSRALYLLRTYGKTASNLYWAGRKPIALGNADCNLAMAAPTARSARIAAESSAA